VRNRAKRAFGEAMRKLGRKLMKKAAPVSRAYQKHELAREYGERQAQAWLAEKLAMSSAANVSQQMRRLDRREAMKKVPVALKEFLEESDDSNS